MELNPLDPENWSESPEIIREIFAINRVIMSSLLPSADLDEFVAEWHANGDTDENIRPPDLGLLVSLLRSGRILSPKIQMYVATLLKGDRAFSVEVKRARGRPRPIDHAVAAAKLMKELADSGVSDEAIALRLAEGDAAIGLEPDLEPAIRLLEIGRELSGEFRSAIADILEGKGRFKIKARRRRGRRRSIDHDEFRECIFFLKEDGFSQDAAVLIACDKSGIERDQGYKILYKDQDGEAIFWAQYRAVVAHLQAEGRLGDCETDGESAEPRKPTEPK